MLEPTEDYRTSVYGGGRDSVYETSSLEYQPQIGPNHSLSRDHFSNQSAAFEPRQGLQYGDIRQQLGTYEDFESQPPTYRNREREYTY